MELEEWTERKDKLKDRYKNREELRKDCIKKLDKENFVFMEYTYDNLIGIYPVGIDFSHTMRDVKWYHTKDDCLEAMETKEKIKQIASILKDHVTIEKLIEDALTETNPNDLNEIFERVVLKKGKVREVEGCYKLILGGKRGTPFEFPLRD